MEYKKVMDSSLITIKPSFLICKRIKLLQSININLPRNSTQQYISKKDTLLSRMAGKEWKYIR